LGRKKTSGMTRKLLLGKENLKEKNGKIEKDERLGRRYNKKSAIKRVRKKSGVGGKSGGGKDVEGKASRKKVRVKAKKRI